MKTAWHSGDAGDIVAAIPVMKSLDIETLYLVPLPNTRQLMTPKQVANIDRLLILCGINSWYANVAPQGVINLNLWRRKYSLFKGKNLAEMQLLAMKQGVEHCLKKWIPLSTRNDGPVVFCRSPRYRNTAFPWKTIYQHYKDPIFIGTNAEHIEFQDIIGPIEYVKTNDLYDVAIVLAMAKFIVCNQSCPMWIAEGLKKSYLLEVLDIDPNCMFYRPGVYHNWDTVPKD